MVPPRWAAAAPAGAAIEVLGQAVARQALVEGTIADSFSALSGALSGASPTVPIEPVVPAPRSASVNAIEVY